MNDQNASFLERAGARVKTAVLRIAKRQEVEQGASQKIYELAVAKFGLAKTEELIAGMSRKNKIAGEILRDELAKAGTTVESPEVLGAGASTGKVTLPTSPAPPTAPVATPVRDDEAQRQRTIAAATAILREPEPQAITWNAQSLAALIDCTYGKGMSRQIAFNAPYESNDELKAISEETQAYPYTSGPGREALSKKYGAAIAKRDAEREAKMKSEAMPKLTQFLCDNKVRVKGLSYAGCKIRDDERIEGWTPAEAQKSIDAIVSVWSGAEESIFDNSKAANDARSFMVRVNERLPKNMVGRAAQVGEKLEISKIK